MSAEKKAKEAAQQKAKEEAAHKQSAGGQSKSNKTKEKGHCGEWIAKMDLIHEKFDDVIALQNNSEHGTDLIRRNSTNGKVKVREAKTTDGPIAASLSKDQRRLGGADFTKDRLTLRNQRQRELCKIANFRIDAAKATDYT